MKALKLLRSSGFVIALAAVFLVGSLITVTSINPAQAAQLDTRFEKLQPPAAQGGPVCTCSREDTLNCRDFRNQNEAQTCFDQCLASAGYDVHDLDSDGNGEVCEATAYSIPPGGQDTTPSEELDILPEEVPGANNLVHNGNFEFGFYQVPQLGFESHEVGNVPVNWDWFKSNTYGKVTIYNNEGFGLICRDDTGAAQAQNQPQDDDSEFGPIPDLPYRIPNNSLSLHLQSTDQPDMRLGLYQTINVEPGRDYRFSMSGTIQAQSGSQTLQSSNPKDPLEAQNNTIEISFDHNGGSNWQAVPLRDRHIVEFKEEKLEFKVSEDDEDIAIIQDFETVVHANSNKMTIFITAWRKWANWRTTIYTIDCVSLTPIDSTGVPLPAKQTDPSPVSPENGAQPASVSQPSEAEQSAPESQPTETQIIPPSGGILDNAENSTFIIIVSIVVLVGLVGAGVWNTKRQQ